MPTKVSCAICCEETTKKLVSCKACDFAACKDCTQRYLFDREGERRDAAPSGADCMNCHAVWDRDHLAASFSKKWVTTDWKVHRENMLFERERGMMPATQLYIAWHEEIQELKKRQLAIQMEANQLKQNIWKLACAGGYNPKGDLTLSKAGNYSDHVRSKALEMKRKHDALKKQVDTLHHQITNLRLRDPTRPRPQDDTVSMATPEAALKLALPCPVDGCMGFILRPGYTCGMCSTKVCQDCHMQVNDGNHTCNPNDILTAKALASESKPCPHCAVPTFKISGCNQMWCVVCHKPWDWKTGKPENGVIHNPHYFEYIRNNPQAADRAPRNLELGGQDIVPGNGDNVFIVGHERRTQRDFVWVTDPAAVPPAATLFMYVIDPDYNTLISTIYNRMAHFLHNEINELLTGYFTDTMDLRISFMRKEITEQEFKVKLQRREKMMLKNTEYVRTIRSFCVAARNIMRDIVRMAILVEDAMKLLVQLWQESGEHIKAIAATYQAKTPTFFEFSERHMWSRQIEEVNRAISRLQAA